MYALVLAAAEEGGHAANNWLYGDWKEVVVTGIASILLFALLWWKGGPAIKDMWNGRIERIATDVSNAEDARTEAERALAEANARVADLESEKTRLLTEAKATAEAVKTQIIDKATEDAAELKRRAAADAEASKAQAGADLEAEVANLALGAAEAIVHNSLDDATQSALVDAYITGVSA